MNKSLISIIRADPTFPRSAKVLRFEVLAEDEWEAKLNEMLRE